MLLLTHVINVSVRKDLLHVLISYCCLTVVQVANKLLELHVHLKELGHPQYLKPTETRSLECKIHSANADGEVRKIVYSGIHMPNPFSRAIATIVRAASADKFLIHVHLATAWQRRPSLVTVHTSLEPRPSAA